MTDISLAAQALPPCGLRRRLAATIYELLPVAAIVIAVGGAFVGIAHITGHTGERLDRATRIALFATWYGALAVYFVWCWRAGQTLPMKAWRLRVVSATPSASWRPFLLRYFIASLTWGLGVGALLWLREHPWSFAAWAALIPLTAALAWRFVDHDRQTLYDRLAGTRLVVEPRPSAT